MALEHRVMQPHKRPASLVHRRTDPVAFFVAVQNRELARHDDPLVLDESHVEIVHAIPVVYSHDRIVGNLRGMLPEPLLPTLFVVAELHGDRDAVELLPHPFQEGAAGVQLLAKVPVLGILLVPRNRIEIGPIAVQQQSVDPLRLEVVDRGPQRRLVVVRDVDVGKDADAPDDPEVVRQPRLGLRFRHLVALPGGARRALQFLEMRLLPLPFAEKPQRLSHPRAGLLERDRPARLLHHPAGERASRRVWVCRDDPADDRRDLVASAWLLVSHPRPPRG